MTSVDTLLQALLAQAVALVCACAAVALTRPLLRRSLGAHAMYLVWILVPCALVATPAASFVDAELLPAQVVRVVLAPMTRDVAVPLAAPSGPRAVWFAAAWLVGVAGLLAAAWRRHRRFTAALREGANAGPLVLGVWRPRLWLPADFEQRFEPAERALILAHEQVHLRRRDNAWNLFALAVLAMQWFNPVAWWAWQRLRSDQELSCDALAVCDRLQAGDTRAVGRYLHTLLKAQGLAGLSPAAAGWSTTALFFSHPLVERIRVLKTSPASQPGRVVAARFVALIAGALAAAVAVAVETPSQSPGTEGPTVMTQVAIEVDGQLVASPQLLGRYGQPTKVAIDDAGGTGPLAVSLELSARPDDHVHIAATLHSGPDEQVFAASKLIMRDRTPARVDALTPDGVHTVSVTFTPGLQKTTH